MSELWIGSFTPRPRPEPDAPMMSTATAQAMPVTSENIAMRRPAIMAMRVRFIRSA